MRNLILSFFGIAFFILGFLEVTAASATKAELFSLKKKQQCYGLAKEAQVKVEQQLKKLNDSNGSLAQLDKLSGNPLLFAPSTAYMRCMLKP